MLFAPAALAGDFDGTWAGKWSGGSSAKIHVVNDVVKAYYFRLTPQGVGATKRTGKALVFGSDYRITMTMTGKNTAHASYRSKYNGSAEADLVRN